MTRKQKIALALGLTLLLFVLGFLASPFLHPEPRYHDKTLTAWAEQYGSNHWSSANRAADREAEFAIRQIGTNGIPFLLSLMQTSDTPIKKKLRTIFPKSWHDSLHLVNDSGKLQSAGAHGLAALGTNAPSAVPGLIELGTHHPESHGRYLAVFALRTLGPAAEPAIPFFIQCLTNHEMTIRDDAALGLGSIRRQPGVVVPALIKFLESATNSPGAFDYQDAIQSLGRFGPEAKAAVPTLVSLLDNPNRGIREAVTNALPRIDRKAAADADVR